MVRSEDCADFNLCIGHWVTYQLLNGMIRE